MVRRMVGVMIFLILAGSVGLPAEATETGRIRIQLEYGVPVDRGEVMLLCVAEPLESGYRLKETYGGGIIRQEEATSPELAQWLVRRIDSTGVGKTLDDQGAAEFSGLERGLYMVVQTQAPKGWSCVAPFLVPIPLDGEWEVLACPKQAALLTKSPQTGQHPAPIFAAMGLVLSGTGLYLCMEKLRKK